MLIATCKPSNLFVFPESIFGGTNQKTHGVLQRPDEVPEVLQVVLEHEEEEGGEGAEDDHELHGEGGEPLEAEPHGGHDLHEGLLEAKQLGELDGGGEHREGELKWN